MSSKLYRRYSADVKGILYLDNGIITVGVEDVDEPVVLADFIADFKDKEVKITVAYGEEL